MMFIETQFKLDLTLNILEDSPVPNANVWVLCYLAYRYGVSVAGRRSRLHDIVRN